MTLLGSAAPPHRRRLRLFSSLALAGLLSVATIGTASAHSELESTSPASGATVTTAPTKVQLTFGEDIKTVGDGIVVTAPDAARVDTGEAVIKGTVATQSLKPLTQPGTYTVRYRIVSADGHVVSSSYKFVYKPVATASPTSTPATSPVAAETSATSTSSSTWVPWTIGGIAVLALIVVLVLRRGGNRAPAPGADG